MTADPFANINQVYTVQCRVFVWNLLFGHSQLFLNNYKLTELDPRKSGYKQNLTSIENFEYQFVTKRRTLTLFRLEPLFRW